MPSSISSSERARLWPLVGVALLTFALVLAPVEIGLRAVEKRFGRDARFGYPGTDAAKLSWFMDALKGQEPPRVLVVGNSQAEYGVHPGVLAQGLQIQERDVYNLAFSGTSALSGLELIRRLDLRPQVLIVCLSSADLSRPMIERGNKLLASALQADAGRPTAGGGPKQSVEAMLAAGVARLLRSTDARYRRTPADYVRLLRNPGAISDLADFGRFMSSGALGREVFAQGRYYIAYFSRGFLGLEMLKPWQRDDFERDAVAPSEVYYRETIFPSYRSEGAEHWRELGAHLARLKEQGTRVILVRLPQYGPFAASEDRETDFERTLRDFARAKGDKVLTPADLAPGFVSSPANFRDAAHLHAGSAVTVTKWLAGKIATSPRPRAP